MIDECLEKLEKKRNKLLQQRQQRSEDKKEETGSSDAEKNQLNQLNVNEPVSRRRRSGAPAASSASQPSGVQPVDAETTQSTSPVLRADGQVTEDEEIFVSSSKAASASNAIVEPRAIIFQVGVNDILITDPTTGSVEAKNYEQISKCQTGLQV